MKASAPDNILNDAFFVSAFSVDCVVFGIEADKLCALIIRRGTQPFEGKWALPGDLVYPDENLDTAVSRVLSELTGLSSIYMAQTAAYGEVGRHPLGRVVTISYYSLIRITDYNRSLASNNQNLSGSVSAIEAQWFAIDEIPDLAFDHQTILTSSLHALRQKARTEPIGLELLPSRFTFSQLQMLYEAVFEVKLDTRNFRKKISGYKLLVDINKVQSSVAHRPAKLYRFDTDKYEALKEQGFRFDP